MGLSLASSLKTGNPALDMLISGMVCFLVPMVIADGRDILSRLFHALRQWLRRTDKKRVYREIQTKSTRSMYGYLTNEDKNHLLQKAILFYIQQFKERWSVEAQTAQLSLMETDQDFSDDSDSDDEDGPRNTDSDSDDDTPKKAKRTGQLSYMEKQLRELSLVTSPTDGQDVEVVDGIWFRRNGEDEGDGNGDSGSGGGGQRELVELQQEQAQDGDDHPVDSGG